MVLENKDFESIIAAHNDPQTVVYCDPPYYEAECYTVEFPRSDHQRLHDALAKHKGFAVVSYNSLCAAVGLCFACLGRGGKEQAMEEKKNLCAPIPLSLHQRLRTEQEQRGQTLADYITDILKEHFEGGARTMNANNRTIAFQVPEELFGRLKDYLARNGLKQKDFILGLIERELNDAGNEE